MKKTTCNISFTNNVLSLILSFGITLLATASVFADPLKETVIARGSLSHIVKKNYPNSQLSKAQIMIAILAQNPSAFRGANINFMLGNKTLSLPSEAMIASIPIESANSLLAQHNRFYRQGKTGNLTPPTFINSGADPVALEKLKNQHSKQTARVEQLSEESTRLKNLVEHLESEKDKRDEDLQALEEKIQALKNTKRIERPKTTEENSPATQRLKDKNAALQQQLVESKSELAENNRTTISLERRVIELQDQQTEQSTTHTNNAHPTQKNPIMTTTEEVLDAPATDLNGNIVSPERTLSSGGFDSGKLVWALPLLAILVGLGFLLKRFFSTKKHSELNLDDINEVDDFDFTTPKMKTEDRAIDNQDILNEVTEEASLEISIKLDVARAYMEAEDNQSAYAMLQEVIKEGTTSQQQEAKQLLAKL